MVSFIKMLFQMVKLSEFLPNNQEIERICYDVFDKYVKSIQSSVYDELLSHVKAFQDSANHFCKHGDSDRSIQSSVIFRIEFDRIRK